MAIRKEKYVDITSKLGGASVAARRSLTGRVFTASPALGFHQIAQFHDATEVMEFFGSDSKEYKFAVKYFGFVSKSATKAEMISFAGWGGSNNEAGRTYKTYDIAVNDATLTGGGVVCVAETGEKTRFNTVYDALEHLGDDVIANITLNTNIVYVSSRTAKDAALMESLKSVTGMSSFTLIPRPTKSDGTALSDSDNEDDFDDLICNKLINALVVGKNQIVNFDLNGHIFAGDTNCFVNLGSLTIFDSIGTGRAFTTSMALNVYQTNANGKILTTSLPHSDRNDGTKATCEVSRNVGHLMVEGGWYGTAKCVLSPFVNETTWGNAISCQENSVTEINGGYFTTVTHFACANKLAGDTSRTTILGNYNYSEQGKTTIATSQPFGSVVNVYKNGYLTVNGGTFFGLYDDAIEVIDFNDTTLSPEFGVVEVNGGSFYGGFSSGTFYPRSDSKYTRSSMICAKGASDPFAVLPSATNSIGGSCIVVNGGVFQDNISPYAEDGGTAVSSVPDDANYSASHFTGFVHINKCTTNFTYDAEFEDETYAKKFRPVERGEKPVEALARVDALNDNFGSFAFIDALTPEEAKEVAAWNASKNFKYLYSVPVTAENCKEVLETVRNLSGTCYTLDKYDATAEFMPMALFAATKYERANATKVFMYQQFDGEKPSVTTSQEADLYDAFDVDGMGTRFPVNYYGCTQQAGDLISFYQDGYNADGLDTACYCNEVWLKDAIAVELLNTFIALEKIPANNVGAAIVRNAITTILAEAVNNDTVTVGKTLDNVQRTYVDRTAGVADAWQDVENYGYWLNVAVRHRTLSGGRVQYYADYVLIYAKGDAIRKVEGSDILV